MNETPSNRESQEDEFVKMLAQFWRSYGALQSLANHIESLKEDEAKKAYWNAGGFNFFTKHVESLIAALDVFLKTEALQNLRDQINDFLQTVRGYQYFEGEITHVGARDLCDELDGIEILLPGNILAQTDNASEPDQRRARPNTEPTASPTQSGSSDPLDETSSDSLLSKLRDALAFLWEDVEEETDKDTPPQTTDSRSQFRKWLDSMWEDVE